MNTIGQLILTIDDYTSNVIIATDAGERKGCIKKYNVRVLTNEIELKHIKRVDKILCNILDAHDNDVDRYGMSTGTGSLFKITELEKDILIALNTTNSELHTKKLAREKEMMTDDDDADLCPHCRSYCYGDCQAKKEIKNDSK